MGTRNLTMVIDQEGTKKVAQYGQWDGYPSGVGVGVLEFLKDNDLFEKFKQKLPKVRFLDSDGRDKEFIESYEKNTPEWSNEPDNRTEEQKNWWSAFCSRDLADEVLTNIAKSEEKEIILIDREGTAKGSDSWVEWVYVIDLQKNTLSISYNLDNEPVKIYQLDNLPHDEDFVNDLENNEEEED